MGNKARIDVPKNAFCGSMDELLEREKYVAGNRQKLAKLNFHWLYGAMALTGTGVWERFAEDMLRVALNRYNEGLKQSTGMNLPAHPSADLCELLITGIGDYFDFRSFGDLIGKADTVLGTPKNSANTAKNPFRAPSGCQKDAVDDLFAIRNYMMHGSRRSRKSYRKVARRWIDEIEGSTPGASRDYLPKPGTFLSSCRSTGTPRLRRILKLIKKAGEAICKHADANL